MPRHPDSVLRRVAKRLFRAPQHSMTQTGDAPYRRIQPVARESHRPVLLNLATSDGSGQACHPDVVHIPCGFGLRSWPYWMVCTPYPYGNNKFENPELFVSYDGLIWSVPEGVRNPLVPPPPRLGDHNSDPDMLFYEGELWLFFRETVRSRNPNENSIHLTKSGDGIRWTPPVEVLSENSGTELLSPAVIHDGSNFIMWTVEVEPQNGELRLSRRNSTNGLSWSVATRCSVIGLEERRFPWHIDVIQEEDRLSALLISCSQRGGTGSRIHYARSEDEGRIWVAGGFLFDQAYEFESSVQYRGCLHKISDEPPEYRLWYSAASRSNVFSIAYLSVVRMENNMLVPRESSEHRIEASVSALSTSI